MIRSWRIYKRINSLASNLKMQETLLRSHSNLSNPNFRTPIMAQKTNPQKKVALISAKMCLGQGKPGTELGPQYLKNETLLENLELLNCSTVEHTEIDSVQVPKEVTFLNNRNIVAIAKTNQNLSAAVTSAILEGHTPVVLGGDHSLSIGSVFGTAQALQSKSQIGLIWIDAHADINTPMTSWSGNLHGQSVSFLLYELEKYHPKIEAFESWMSPCLTARNIVYIGLRDLDHDETMLVNKFKIKAFCMSDIERMGIREVVRQTFEHLTIDGELLPLHVSVDIDCLDPWFAPSTGTPVLGGLTLSQLMYIGNCVHDSGKLATLDMVEVNPLIKTNEEDLKKTVFSATRGILSFFGYKTIGTHDPRGAIPIPDRRSSLVPPP